MVVIEKAVRIQNGMDFGAFSLCLNVLALFSIVRKESSFLSPSLTFPPPSVCELCFVSAIAELKPVECQHLAHMFISSESVINFLWFKVNETVCACACVCMRVCV